MFEPAPWTLGKSTSLSILLAIPPHRQRLGVGWPARSGWAGNATHRRGALHGLVPAGILASTADGLEVLALTLPDPASRLDFFLFANEKMLPIRDDLIPKGVDSHRTLSHQTDEGLAGGSRRRN